MERFHECVGVLGPHQGLADQNRVGSAGAGALGIFDLKDAAFADFDNVVRDLRD